MRVYKPTPPEVKRRRSGKIQPKGGCGRPGARRLMVGNEVNYNYMPKYRVDNMNPVTEGPNYGSYNNNYNRMRIPSKKHKNRYKNFLKMFPKYAEWKGLK